MENLKKIGKCRFLAVSMLLVMLLVSCKGDNKAADNQISGNVKGDNGENNAVSSTSIAEGNEIESDDWKNGVIKVNGKEYTLISDDLETFMKSGYKLTDAEMETVLNPEAGVETELSDGIHRKLEIYVTNYSSDKPCWKKHGIIRNLSITYGVSDGLESPDIIFPGKITEGLGRDEVISSLGKPDSEHDDYIGYSKSEFSLDIGFDEDKVSWIDYRRDSESVMKANDTADIKKALDRTKESSVVNSSSPSEKLKDQEIKIGKKVYAMPICASDLVELGYGIDDSRMMNPKTSGVPKEFPGIFYPSPVSDKKGRFFYVAYENSGKTLRSIANCRIASLTITEESEKCSIAKGIHIGSEQQEVLNAFGNKKVENETIQYEYKTKKGQGQVTFTLDQGKVSQINMILTEQDQ